MISKRMMAIVAVVALAIPTLGAAAPIVQPKTTERLVEGHTVFTVITQTTGAVNNTNTSRFAAAAAVLVREYSARAGAQAERFPGVLWFNDQYLVDPYYNTGGSASASYRYPCGGAVMAVNAGSADPRISLVGLDGTDVLNAAFGGSSPPQAGGDAPHSTLGVNTVTPAVNSTGTVLPASGSGALLPFNPFQYRESYLITDPNDHSWVIDLYDHINTVSAPPASTSTSSTPVWVVNILGHPGFLPDDGSSTCDPFSDLTVVPDVRASGAAYSPCGQFDTTPSYQHTNPCGSAREHQNEATAAPVTATGARPANCAEGNATTAAERAAFGSSSNTPTGTSAPGPMVAGDYRDQPCQGYAQPANGYCYDGNPQSTNQPDCTNAAVYPVRAYNALLYFRMEDLTSYQGGRTHNALNTDTNGCQADTEWACPGNDDNAEGNSHPFNPHSETSTTDPNTMQPCPYGGSAEPTNHGGSDAQVNTGNGNVCDRVHATFDVDIYFSATGRPLEPVVRTFGVTDLQGSSAPYHGSGTASGSTTGFS